MDSPALRKAVEATQPERVAFELRFSQSKPIYNAITALRSNAAAYNKLNPVQQRIVNLTVKDFSTSGVGLDPEKRRQYNAVIDRLAKLNTNFSNNVMDSTAVRRRQRWKAGGAGWARWGRHRAGGWVGGLS